MEDRPSLTIKASKNTLIVIAKYIHEVAEHEIQLKLVLGYYWQNNLPFIEKFMELFETVVKRAVRQVFFHENLFIKYTIESNDDLDDASSFSITLLEVKADNVEINLIGEVISLEGIDSRGTISKVTSFRRKVKETIEKNIVSTDL